MNHEERYEEVCKPQLDGMSADLKEIKTTLDHFINGNGKLGYKTEMAKVKWELMAYRYVFLAFALRFIYLIGTDVYGFFKNTP